MDYRITTTYLREDIEGFYDAFLSGNKSIHLSKIIIKIITTIFAVLFWGLAALVLISNLSTKSFQLILGALPLTMIFVLLGLWIFSIGRRGFKSKSAWKSYSFKGEQLVFSFLPNGFVLTQRNSETKTDYGGIVRLYEDKFRFYLFISPNNAHILPKRDFKSEVDSFRDYISAATGLQMEHS